MFGKFEQWEYYILYALFDAPFSVRHFALGGPSFRKKALLSWIRGRIALQFQIHVNGSLHPLVVDTRQLFERDIPGNS